ncbi:hypothetical protein J4219_02995 [Candidatus Woesearchaeota archaeon]|nr:hypothetical protein [Candidatus Woesearchaeota archaeon]
MDDVVRANGIWVLSQALKQYDAGRKSYYAMGAVADTLLKDVSSDVIMQVLVGELLVPISRVSMVYSAHKFYLSQVVGEAGRIDVQASPVPASPFLPIQKKSNMASKPIARFDLVQTTDLEDLVLAVGKRLPDWKDYVLHDELFAIFGNDKNSFKSKIGNLGELIVQRAVEVECDSDPDRYEYQPIPDGASAGRLRFVHKNGAVCIRDVYQTVTDYDCIALVRDLPVLFEVKMGNLNGLNSQMQRQINPLMRYFQTSRIGYVLVRKQGDAQNYAWFEESGGIVLRWYCGMQRFRDEVQDRVFGKK